jgi:hypothetical protein
MSSIASLESAMLTNTEKATLLRELADEFGYKLYSKTPAYRNQKQTCGYRVRLR